MARLRWTGSKPITGLNSVAGLYEFVSNHEGRHQGQLREILGDPAFPTD